VAPTEDMASLSAGRAAAASNGTPASATAKSGSPAAGSPLVGGAPGSTGALKAKGSTAATPRAGGATASAPATPAGATKSSGAASAAARQKAACRSHQANGAPPSRKSSAAGSQTTQPPPPPRRFQATGGSASASRASSAATRSADEHAAVPRTAAARVLLPRSPPNTPSAAAVAATAAPSDKKGDPIEQESPPPVPRRGRLPVVEETEPAEPKSLVEWTVPPAPSQLEECRLRKLYSAIPLPQQGPAWQRWLTRHPVQYELPAAVVRDVPALLEAGGAPWVEHAAARLSNVMDGATADDLPPVVASEWVCFSSPYLWEGDAHFHHQDAFTERRLRERSAILMLASQVESTQVHASARLGTLSRRLSGGRQWRCPAGSRPACCA